jgi:hypothetical protein
MSQKALYWSTGEYISICFFLNEVQNTFIFIKLKEAKIISFSLPLNSNFKWQITRLKIELV